MNLLQLRMNRATLCLVCARTLTIMHKLLISKGFCMIKYSSWGPIVNLYVEFKPKSSTPAYLQIYELL